MGAADKQRQHLVGLKSNPKQFTDQVIQFKVLCFHCSKKKCSLKLCLPLIQLMETDHSVHRKTSIENQVQSASHLHLQSSRRYCGNIFDFRKKAEVLHQVPARALAIAKFKRQVDAKAGFLSG